MRLLTLRMTLLLLGLFTLALFTAGSDARAAQDAPAIVATGPGYVVAIESVVRQADAEGVTLYKVSYNYAFSNRDSVYIQGVGEVPPKGQLRYLSAEARLVFSASSDGPIIVTVPLNETLIPMGGGILDFPPTSSFTDGASRTGQWAHGASFPYNATKVLEMYFLAGHAPVACPNRLCYKTTFRIIQVRRNKKVKVAILISQPFPEAQISNAFRVQYKAYQKVGSGLWDEELDEESRAAAATFLTELLGILQTRLD